MRLRYDRHSLYRATLPADFGQVAVLFGGSSAEREVSLISGKAVLGALERRGVSRDRIRSGAAAVDGSAGFEVQRAWIALHGPGGEDGTLQGALEFLGMPYTGSGVMGSAIGMDKLRSKRLAQSVGIPTAEFVVLKEPQDLDIALERLGLPMIVKPGSQGSSVGMARVEQAQELPEAWKNALRTDPIVFAEPWITGGEYTVAILQGQALPSIRIETPRRFTTTRPNTCATTRATSVRRGCHRRLSSIWGNSRWRASRCVARKAGVGRTS
jgi:D-alanine-D-alanine ligase